MNIEQFVMAYKVEQDRLRAMLPEGFTSLRPVLRINGEIHDDEQYYIELNTPVEGFGKRGWLNIANWTSLNSSTNPTSPTRPTSPNSQTMAISCRRNGKAVTFDAGFLEITYTGVGIEGGCPAERDNDGCFFLGEEMTFVPAEKIDQNKEFCDCSFAWKLGDDSAKGISIGGKSVPAIPTEPEYVYPKQALTAENAAKIPCEQILGSYMVRFVRGEKGENK